MKTIAGVVGNLFQQALQEVKRTTAMKTQAPTRHLEAKEVALMVVSDAAKYPLPIPQELVNLLVEEKPARLDVSPTLVELTIQCWLQADLAPATQHGV